MATWVHCNKCFTQPSSSFPRFHLTSCSHIICSKCLTHSQAVCEKAKKPLHCCYCSTGSIKVIPIDSTLPKVAKMFFMDLHKLWAEKFQQLMKTYQFQLEQCKLVARLAQNQQAHLIARGNQDGELSQMHKKLEKENESLKISVQFYKSEVEKRDEEIEQLKKEIAAFNNRTPESSQYSMSSPYSPAHMDNMYFLSPVQNPMSGRRMAPLDPSNATICDMTIAGSMSNVSTAYTNQTKDTSFHLRMDDSMDMQDQLDDSTTSISTQVMLGLSSDIGKRKSLPNTSITEATLFKRPYKSRQRVKVKPIDAIELSNQLQQNDDPNKLESGPNKKNIPSQADIMSLLGDSSGLKPVVLGSFNKKKAKSPHVLMSGSIAKGSIIALLPPQ